MQRAFLFVALACLALTHLGQAVHFRHSSRTGEPNPSYETRECMGSLTKPGFVANAAFEPNFKLTLVKWLSSTPLSDETNIGNIVIPASVAKTLLSGKTLPQQESEKPAEGTPYCCQGQGLSQLKCRQEANQENLCYTARTKLCKPLSYTHSIAVNNLRRWRVACSDLTTWKTPDTSSPGFLGLNKYKIIKQDSSNPSFTCCHRKYGSATYHCGPLDPQSGLPNDVNFELLVVTPPPSDEEKKELAKKQGKDPLDLDAIDEETKLARTCSVMLWNLQDNEIPNIFLTMTDMMIQQTRRIFHFDSHDKADLLYKTLLRSYLRFYLASLKEGVSHETVIDAFRKWWQDPKSPLPAPEPYSADKNPKGVLDATILDKFPCPLADTLFSQDTERLEKNTQKNERVKGNIMFAIKTVTSIASFGAKAAGTAFGGPAAGAAAGAISQAILSLASGGAEVLLERNVGIAKIRREARSAILKSYQGLLYDENAYKSSKCGEVVKNYMQVVHKFLTASDDDLKKWTASCKMCIPELRVNNLESYSRAFSLLNRIQGFEQRVIGEIESYRSMLWDKTKEIAPEVIETLKGLKEELDSIAKEKKNDKETANYQSELMGKVDTLLEQAKKQVK